MLFVKLHAEGGAKNTNKGGTPDKRSSAYKQAQRGYALDRREKTSVAGAANFMGPIPTRGQRNTIENRKKNNRKRQTKGNNLNRGK